VINGDLVKMIDQLAESREDRLAASDIGLPSIFWEVIGSLVVLLRGSRHAMSLSGLKAGLALLISLVFIFDQPFLGTISVKPTPIAKALHVMQTRVLRQLHLDR
jgi:hypothetical protein